VFSQPSPVMPTSSARDAFALTILNRLL
jgi:hypothetical protein